VPYDLIGDLSKSRLLHLVKPLIDGKKSGMVAIDGTDLAQLYIEGGDIVHGIANGLTGEEAIRTIMDLDSGRVRFNWQTSPERRTVTAGTASLMSIWSDRETEWGKIRTRVASSDAAFCIVVNPGGGDKTILERQWAVLALCDGTRSVSEIAGLLGRSLFDVSQTICELVEASTLKESEITGTSRARPKKTIDETFFLTIETELKRVLGPVARIIMNDTLDAFQKSRDTFPRDQVEGFIRTVCDQITDDRKREKFGNAAWVAWLSSLEDS
jgi:hypothetical protein